MCRRRSRQGEGCTHSGSRIMKGTMQEYAGLGAYPCPDVRGNGIVEE